MAPAPKDKLTLLPFPQRWEDGNISLRVLVLPRGNPLQPLMTGIPAVADGPAFVDAGLKLKAMLIPSLDELPSPANVSDEIQLGNSTPGDLRKIYQAVAGQFDIDQSLEAGVKDARRGLRIKKFLSQSYRSSFAFSAPRSPYALLDDSYACAIRDGRRLQKTPPPPPTRKVVWGKIIAQALRQPLMAKRMGLLYETKVKPPSADLYEHGGWIYVQLDKTSAYYDQVVAEPSLLAYYAARIPPLGKDARNIFAAVLFPVASSPPAGQFDELYAEAASYDDGFAKIVHCAQQTTADPIGLEDDSAVPPIKDTGVQLGWDDEQLVIWMNRQAEDAAVETRNAPMGVLGYRVDVRKAGNLRWYSLMKAEAKLGLGSIDIGTFKGELNVEVGPVQLDGDETSDEWWMPVYFTQWEGRSLVTEDQTALKLSGATNAQLKGLYKSAGGDQVPLRYGETYEFRVRLSDTSGGGPGPDSDSSNPAPAPVGKCDFRRLVPPREVTVQGLSATPDPKAPPPSLQISRPGLGYPTAIFTGLGNAEQTLLADLETIKTEVAAGSKGRDAFLPDPDVRQLEIEVQVKGLEFDTGFAPQGEPVYQTIYTAIRNFPAYATGHVIDLELDYQDVKDASSLSATVSGALPIPTAREVLIKLTPICKEDAGLAYFGSQEARRGKKAEVRLRAAASDERELFVPGQELNRLRAIMLQPDEALSPTLLRKLAAEGKGEEAETDLVHRLAAELDLEASGLTLKAPAGKRVVFACSQAIPHTLAPDMASITFAAKTDLVLRWINVITLGLQRDWSWDGADSPALSVRKHGTGPVGNIRLPGSINPAALEQFRATGKQPDRSSTLLYFFDAVDPKPTPPNHPQELQVSYDIAPAFKHTPAQVEPTLNLTVDLPIAVKPVQTPKLVSAGIALSPYTRADDYSSSDPRDRMLWLEFDRDVDNPVDTYFGRVLSHSPDPMLTKQAEVTVPPEPPLPIASEHIRVIRPGLSDDKAGLSAMQQLIPTNSKRHYLVPLPPGLTKASRELFGFFTYEFRVGHFDAWSTAQARYGPALRVTGAQHPAPTLFCQPMRTAAGITVSASHAHPVFDKRSMMPSGLPESELWFLLYAQVTQADNEDKRNILLGRKRGWYDRKSYGVNQELDLRSLAAWPQPEIENYLEAYALDKESPLSVMSVELLPSGESFADPLGQELGEVRILRSSPLTKVPPVCA